MTHTKTELIRKLRSPHNKIAVQAVAELRAHGWLGDGSLERTHLRFVHLQGADLYEARLRSATLSMADLRGADLSMADLEGARLTKADLHRADLSEANLRHASMTRANLQGARNLTDTQLAQASRLRGAILPDGSLYDGRFRLAGDIGDARILKVDTDDPQAMADFYGVFLEEYLDGLLWVEEHLLIAVEAKREHQKVSG